MPCFIYRHKFLKLKLNSFTYSAYSLECADWLINNSYAFQVDSNYELEQRSAPFYYEENGELYSNAGVRILYGWSLEPFYRGYDFEIIDYTENLCDFVIYFYEMIGFDANMQRVGVKSSMIKENGEWRLTEMLYKTDLLDN